MELEAKHLQAPELYGSFWLNAEPIALRECNGGVVLLDFWDYPCLNSIRTLPYIQEWQKKYQEFGLTVIGIHTPEFEFGASRDRVQESNRNFQDHLPCDARQRRSYLECLCHTPLAYSLPYRS